MFVPELFQPYMRFRLTRTYTKTDRGSESSDFCFNIGPVTICFWLRTAVNHLPSASTFLDCRFLFLNKSVEVSASWRIAYSLEINLSMVLILMPSSLIMFCLVSPFFSRSRFFSLSTVDKTICFFFSDILSLLSQQSTAVWLSKTVGSDQCPVTSCHWTLLTPPTITCSLLPTQCDCSASLA